MACLSSFALELAFLFLLSPSVPESIPAGLDDGAASACSCSLPGADWSGRDLEFADLRGCDLRDVNLSGSRLVGARLQGARLDGADLRRADLRLADLTGASLRDADLREADLSSASISGAVTLDGAHWAGAVCPEEVVADAVAGCSASPTGS